MNADDDATPNRAGNRSPPTMLPPTTQINVPTPREMREIVLKWTFQTSDENAVQLAHALTLQAIAKNFPSTEVQIVSSLTGLVINHQEISELEFATPTRYTSHFRPISKSPRSSNDGKNPSKKYSVYHRIYSTRSLREIRQNYGVMDSLRGYKCRFSEHLWREDITNVKDVGWFISYNPKYGTCEQMLAGVRRTVSEKAHVSEADLPTFKIYKTTIFHMYENIRYVTYAYVLQCLGKDVEYLKGCLFATYDKEAKFVYFLSKYSKPRGYANAICAQQLYLDDTSVVAIKGISPTIMWSFDNYLKNAMSGIHHVLSTPKSNSEGRYNLVTTKANRKALALALDARLSKVYAQFLQEAPPTDPRVHDEAFPWPAMASRIYVRQDEQASESGSPANSVSSECGMSVFSLCSYAPGPGEGDNDCSDDPPVVPDTGSPNPVPPTTVTTMASVPGLAPVSDLTSRHTHQSTEIAILKSQVEFQKEQMEFQREQMEFQRGQIEAMRVDMAFMKNIIARFDDGMHVSEAPSGPIASLPDANPISVPRSPVPDNRPTKRNDLKSTPPPAQPPPPSDTALDQTARQLWAEESDPPQDMEETDPPTDQQ